MFSPIIQISQKTNIIFLFKKVMIHLPSVFFNVFSLILWIKILLSKFIIVITAGNFNSLKFYAVATNSNHEYIWLVQLKTSIFWNDKIIRYSVGLSILIFIIALFLLKNMIFRFSSAYQSKLYRKIMCYDTLFKALITEFDFLIIL